jgi:hypothetical protein
VASPTKVSGNGSISNSTTRGFFITYAGTNSGTTVTATLSNATGKFNWCAHGSDYPPAAVINAAGGYTLKGTPPFTINGTMTVNPKTLGAGTCITSIIDLTGNPDGIVPALPSLSSPNSPLRCSSGAVTLSVTVGGGTTTAMTYTWNIGGTTYTNQTNSYTTGSLSTNTTYSVKVKNANNCESNTVNGSITVGSTPSAPNSPSNNSRCGTGNVTFSATAPSGCTIDWYTTSGGNTTVATGTTSYTRSISTTTSYYAQSRNTTTGCTSASRLTVTGTVTNGSGRDVAPNSCGCASGLTRIGSYCRDLIADNATHQTCSGMDLEWYENGITPNYAALVSACNAKGGGWRPTTGAELVNWCPCYGSINIGGYWYEHYYLVNPVLTGCKGYWYTATDAKGACVR